MSAPVKFPPASIADEEMLARRIHPNHIKPDGTISSAAFTDDELSVDRSAYRSTEDSLRDHPDKGLAHFQAGRVRSEPLLRYLELKSDPDFTNPAHALVLGKKTRAISRELAKCAQIIVPVPSSRG